MLHMDPLRSILRRHESIMRPPGPLVPPPYYGPHADIPPYRSNNVGGGYNARENEFRRLQQDALNSPNFALDYLNGREKIIKDPPV